MTEGSAVLEILQPKVSKIENLKIKSANNLRTVYFSSSLQKEKMVSRSQLTSSAQNFNNLEQKIFQPFGKNQYFRHFDFFHTFPQLYFLICYETWQKLLFQRFWHLSEVELNRKWPKNLKFSCFSKFSTPKTKFFEIFFASFFSTLNCASYAIKIIEIGLVV